MTATAATPEIDSFTVAVLSIRADHFHEPAVIRAADVKLLLNPCEWVAAVIAPVVAFHIQARTAGFHDLSSHRSGSP